MAVTPDETSDYTALLGLVRHLQRGTDVLGGRVSALEGENQALRQDLASLSAANGDVSAENAVLRAEVTALEAEIAKLREKLDLREKPDVPEFVKPDRPPSGGEKKPRKPRRTNCARAREEPTREERHGLDRCPECDGPLSGGYEKWRRQVIDLPVTTVEVTDHVMWGYWCGYCQKEQVAKASPEALGVVGGHRLGVRLMSLVAHLHIEGRMPLSTIQQLLLVRDNLSISRGELSEILHTVAKQGAGDHQAILRGIRSAPVVHADETGWRESGKNGYVWSFSTPPEASERLRYFAYLRSRGGKVVAEILGLEGHKELEPGEEAPHLGTFTGKLVTDFYSAYNTYLGPIQRCWVHLLRDLHQLKKEHPDDLGVFRWSAAIRAVYDRAKEWKPEHPDTRFEERERLRAQHGFERQLMKLAKLYLDQAQAPQRLLAKRIEKHLPELFVFVLDPRVPSDNNPAERSVRPTVIARKISGGTRSARGSHTKMTLMTLFGTWKLQGLNTLETCRQMLLDPKPVLVNPSAVPA